MLMIISAPTVSGPLGTLSLSAPWRSSRSAQGRAVWAGSGDKGHLNAEIALGAV